MKKFFTLVTATAITLLSLVSNQSRASHAVAADITYQYVGPNQYLLTLRLYRDCAGISAPSSVSIGYSSSCFANGSITLQPLPGTGAEIPPSPCIPTIVSSCNGGSGYGVQEYIYQGVVTLPGPCVDWRFSYSLCCRNDQINTLVNPATFSLFVSTTLDNFNFPTNSSPVFANIPVTQFCINNQFYYNQQASDIDGDSLVFSLAINENALNTSVVYAAPYGPLYPLASSTPFTIDAQTGIISFTPSMLQVGVMAVVVEEYRQGVKIGEIKRDMQMNVVNTCIGTAPAFEPPVDPSGNPAPYYTAACGDTSIYLVLDQPIQCGSVVPTDIRILTPQGALNPVLSATPVNCINGQSDSILVTFFYPLTAGITYAFTKVGFDNNTFLSECGVQMPEFDSIPYNVIDPGIFDPQILNVGCSFDNVSVSWAYEIACNTLAGDGSEFFLVDANGTTYPVTSVTGCPGGNSYTNTLNLQLGTMISPATPLYLIVQNGTDANTFTNRCNTYILPGDTLAQFNVQNFLIVDLGTDVTLCPSDPLPVLDAGNSGSIYQWYLNGTLLPDTTQTITASQSGTYTVAVAATPSCNGTDSVQVTINPAPVVNLGNNISICSTDPIPSLDAGSFTNATYQWYLDGNLISGATSQQYQPTAAGTYSVTVNTGGTCEGVDSLVLSIEPFLVVAIGPDQVLCSGDPLPVLDAGVPNGTYNWLLNGVSTGVTTQTIQTTGAGTYTVEVTSVSGCTGSDDLTVTIVNTPVVTLADGSVCPGNSLPTLDAGNPGSQYLWNTGEATQTISPSAPGVYTVTVTNSNSGLSCSSSASATLAFYNDVIVTLGSDLTACDGAGSQTIDAGNSGSTFEWSFNNTVIPGQTGQTINVTDAGTYSVLVTDPNGCTGSDAVTLTVNALPVINIGDDAFVCPGDEFPTLDATHPDASTYAWYFNGTVVGSGPTLATNAFGTYSVQITDFNGCVGTDTMVVEQKPCEIEIPNVFTPGNGDIKNDVFFIKNLDSNPNTKVVILNRWGNEVYNSSNYQNDWDGDDLPDGTYFYVVVVSSGKDYKGTLKLIRQK